MDVPNVSPMTVGLFLADTQGETCPKRLGGPSFRAPATVQDQCSKEVHGVVDFRGAGFDYTMIEQSNASKLPKFPDPEVVAHRLIKAFREPDVYGEWFYLNMHPEARLKYGGRAQVQWFLSSPRSLMMWLGTASDFRVKRYFQDFRNVMGTLDIEVKLAQGGTMQFGFEFKRNDMYDTYAQTAPDMSWKIYRMYPIYK